MAHFLAEEGLRVLEISAYVKLFIVQPTAVQVILFKRPNSPKRAGHTPAGLTTEESARQLIISSFHHSSSPQPCVTEINNMSNETVT